MVKVPISAIAKNIILFAKANATPIATGAVILGMVSAVVLAVKATKESVEDVEEVKDELEVDELTSKEVIRIVWRRFIPVILILGLTIACLLVNTNRMMKRYAALSTAYALSESYLKDYVEATRESVGAKKEQTIHDTAVDKQAQKHPIETSERGIIETGHGDTLFYDKLTTRWFKDSIEHVKSVENYLSGIYETEDKLYADDYARALLGVNSNFEQMGWQKTGKIDGTHVFKLDYTSGLTNSMTPYIAIDRIHNPLVIL